MTRDELEVVNFLLLKQKKKKIRKKIINIIINYLSFV
jgi:hypothetical protein